MPIYTPNDIANMPYPSTVEDAAAKAGYAFVCRSAPYLAGFALLTGNIPAAAGAAAIDVACNLPLIPVPDPPLPFIRPAVGGERDIMYNCSITNRFSTVFCEPNPLLKSTISVRGPVSRIVTQGNLFQLSCLDNQAVPASLNSTRDGLGNEGGWGGNFPQIGDYFTVFCTPQDGSADSPSYPPVVPNPLPDGSEEPPGWPDNPYLPGYDTNQPIYTDPENPEEPTRWIPFKIPDVALPIFVVSPGAFQVPINAPITIPVKLEVPVDVNVTPTLTIQIDKDGNLRTPPDLICPCNDGLPDSPGGATPPEIDTFSVPYYACDSSGGEFVTASISVVRGSVPVDLFDKLLSSSNLAEVGCKSLVPEQVERSRLFFGSSGEVFSPPTYSSILSSEVVSVELVITEYREEDFREITTFPGGRQRKFGAISYCLADTDGGGDQVYLWDTSTYYRLPRRLKPGKIKFIIRPGVSYELWDTGERV